MNPLIVATAVIVKAVLQVLAGVVNEGEAGNTTKLAVSSQKSGAGAIYFTIQQPVALGKKTPELLMVPPPVTDQVPPVELFCVKVTLPPPIQLLTGLINKVGANGRAGDS